MLNSLKILERVKGIEPSSSAWKAVALPLSYTRISPASRRTRPSLRKIRYPDGGGGRTTSLLLCQALSAVAPSK
jgi:hypothetical protein